METIDSDDFDGLINDDRILVDFYADWCGPCKMLLPVLEELEKQSNIEIKKVNVDKSHDLAKRYGVMTIPTLIIFNHGKEIKRHTGYLTLDELDEFIKN